MKRTDRIVAAAFVVLVSTAIVGMSTGETGASFTGTTTNPGQILQTSTVNAPASETAASAIAGRVDLSWPATTTPANGHTVTYLVLRNGVQVGTTAALTYSDTPGSDGTYTYTVQTKIAQGAGFFTSASSPAQSPKSDRTAPVMSVLCNGAACGPWYKATVAVQVGGNDGAGVGMGTATTNVDGAGAATSAAPRTVNVSGESAHSVIYSGADSLGNASSNATLSFGIDLTAPTAPTGLTSVQGGTGAPVTVDLSWTAATDALSGVAGYTVYWVAANPCPVVSPANYPNSASIGAVTSYSIIGLASTRYCAYLTTTDNAGNVSAPTAFTGPTIAR
jgi:hypothetical protein